VSDEERLRRDRDVRDGGEIEIARAGSEHDRSADLIDEVIERGAEGGILRIAPAAVVADDDGDRTTDGRSVHASLHRRELDAFARAAVVGQIAHGAEEGELVEMEIPAARIADEARAIARRSADALVVGLATDPRRVIVGNDAVCIGLARLRPAGFRASGGSDR
jgi:hypothetical protein